MKTTKEQAKEIVDHIINIEEKCKNDSLINILREYVNNTKNKYQNINKNTSEELLHQANTDSILIWIFILGYYSCGELNDNTKEELKKLAECSNQLLIQIRQYNKNSTSGSSDPDSPFSNRSDYNDSRSLLKREYRVKIYFCYIKKEFYEQIEFKKEIDNRNYLNSHEHLRYA